ncbi:MAG TPA: alpha/beta fold hydrolase [Syntrophomonas sp.]|nr:alpha/beta fold hydrolase [Syntrophomonas sp.]
MKEINSQAQPFYFTGNSQQALLFLHGFTASPSEVRVVAEKIHQSIGCSVSGILLPGHGTTPEQLDAVRWPEWYQAVETEIKSLQASFQQVFVGGLSMGGLLALHAGVNLSGLAGVVTINAPIYYHYAVIPLVSDLTGLITPFYHKKGLAEIKKLENQGRFAYRVMPLKAFHSLNHLRKIVMQEVKELKIPALIVQSMLDESVHSRSAEYLYEKTRPQGARTLLLSQSRHIATMGPQQEIIVQEIVSFMEDQRCFLGK